MKRKQYTQPSERATGPEPVERNGLSRAEKRQFIAQIMRLNPLDCFDESGAFDPARARRVLPACAVQQIDIDETGRVDRHGNTTLVRRRIRIRLVDKIRAMRLDAFLLQQEQEERADHQTLAQRRKLRAAQDEDIRRRQQYLEEEEHRSKLEAEIRAMQAEETRQEAQRLRDAGYEGAPLLREDWPRDGCGRPVPPSEWNNSFVARQQGLSSPPGAHPPPKSG